MADTGYGGSEPREGEEPRVVIRDRRRIDPETGEVRPGAPSAPKPTAAGAGAVPPPGVQGPGAAPASAGPADPGPSEALIEELRTELGEREREIAERTEDLQRLQAQFVNFKRRVDRDSAGAQQQAVASVVGALLPILDDIDRAQAHGDLTGPFKAVSDALKAAVTGVGAEAFGEVGDPFDPTIHEAVTHSLSPDVSETQCAAVLRRGYRMGERLVRPAMVAVVEPDETVPPADGGTDEDTGIEGDRGQ